VAQVDVGSERGEITAELLDSRLESPGFQAQVALTVARNRDKLFARAKLRAFWLLAGCRVAFD
jgi:hypothetical protein